MYEDDNKETFGPDEMKMSGDITMRDTGDVVMSGDVTCETKMTGALGKRTYVAECEN
jgi:hypothetical protein